MDCRKTITAALVVALALFSSRTVTSAACPILGSLPTFCQQNSASLTIPPGQSIALASGLISCPLFKNLRLQSADARLFGQGPSKILTGEPGIQVFWFCGASVCKTSVGDTGISLPTAPSVISVSPLPQFFLSTSCSTCSPASPQDYLLTSVTTATGASANATSITVRAIANALNLTTTPQKAQLFLEVVGSCT